MARVYYITHPDVLVDPAVSISAWPLSPVGLSKAQALLRQPWIKQIGAVFSSPEGKAARVAGMLGERLGLEVHVLPALGEIDRSATGYLPAAELAEARLAFFSRPEESARGWERLADAQERTLLALEQTLQIAPPQASAAIVGHGTVGTLLYCHLRACPPQPGEAPPGLGFYFVFDRQTRRVLQTWKAIDEVSVV